MGKDELVGRDPDDLAILPMQLEDVEGQPPCHEAVGIWDPGDGHPFWAGKLAKAVEEDVVDDMAQEIDEELDQAAGVSNEIVPGPLGMAAGRFTRRLSDSPRAKRSRTGCQGSSQVWW
jgi:hypothetical protein